MKPLMAVVCRGRAGSLLVLALWLSCPRAAHPQTVLPEGPGKDVFARVCTQCHGLESIIGSRLNREQWEGLVNDMIARGAPAFENEYEQITSYLAANFDANAPAPAAPVASETPPVAGARGLPAGPGRELVESYCAECHSLTDVTSSRYAADEWRDVVVDMVARGAALLDEEIDLVVKYLASNYGPGGGSAAAGAAGGARREASDESDRPPAGLPQGPGRELVATVCTQCHGLDSVVGLRLSGEEWEGLVNDMIARGAPAFGQDYEVITRYLSANFGKGK